MRFLRVFAGALRRPGARRAAALAERLRPADLALEPGLRALAAFPALALRALLARLIGALDAFRCRGAAAEACLALPRMRSIALDTSSIEAMPSVDRSRPLLL